MKRKYAAWKHLEFKTLYILQNRWAECQMATHREVLGLKKGKAFIQRGKPEEQARCCYIYLHFKLFKIFFYPSVMETTPVQLTTLGFCTQHWDGFLLWMNRHRKRDEKWSLCTLSDKSCPKIQLMGRFLTTSALLCCRKSSRFSPNQFSGAVPAAKFDTFGLLLFLSLL